MDVQKICINCMRAEIRPGGACPRCGFAPASYRDVEGVLPAWTILNGRYLVGTPLQTDQCSIIYHGYDLSLDVPVSLREFFLPFAMGRAANGLDVLYDSNQEWLFKSSREKFSQLGMQVCRRERLEGLQDVSNCFRENHTCYMVEDAEKGIPLPTYLSSRGAAQVPADLRDKLIPIMHSLAALHREGIAPCDIRAEQIMVEEDGTWTLCHYLVPYMPEQGVNRFVSYPGNMAEQGGHPWGPVSDVYGMGLVLQSILRTSRANLPAVETVVYKALQSSAGSRYQSFDEFAGSLSRVLENGGQGAEGGNAVKKKEEKKKRSWLVPALVAAIAVLLVLVILLAVRPWDKDEGQEGSSQNEAENGSGSSQSQDSDEKETEAKKDEEKETEAKKDEEKETEAKQDDEKETEAKQDADSQSQNSDSGDQAETASGTASSADASSDTSDFTAPDDSALMSDEGVPEQTDVTHVVNGQDVKARESEGDSYDDGGKATMMLYLIGSNLESSAGLGTVELEEIRDSGVDLSKTDILVCTGGATSWSLEDVDIPADRNCVLHLGSDGYSIVAQSDDNVSMVDPQTLADFIDYSYENYPAEHYSLVLWDHGGGPVFGYGSDENYPDETMFLRDMRDAMERTDFAKEHRFDWMGFDACLMSSIEVADLWSDYADYMVLSQDSEPGYGWKYSFMKTMNTTANPIVITEDIIDQYMASYDEYSEDRYHPLHTIACLDLSESDAAMTALDTVFRVMEADMDNSYAKQARIRDEVKRYGLQATAGKKDGYDLIDLYDFAERITELYPEEGTALVESLKKMVVYRRSNIGDVDGGVSLYYPYDCEYVYDVADEEEILEDINPSESYRKYVRRMWDEYLKKTSDGDWAMTDVKQGSDEVTLQLTQEQLGELSSAYFTILEDNGDGTYTPVLSECVTWPDESGVLHASSQQDLVYIKNSDGETRQAVPIRQIEKTAAYDYFLTLSVKLLPTIADMLGLPSPNVSVNYHQESGSSDATIESVTQGFSYTDPDYESGGRSEISFAGLTQLSYTLSRFTPTKGDDGNLLPCLEWKEEEEGRTGTIDIDLELGIEKKRIREVGGSYVCQFSVQDVYGEEHGSELVALP